MSPETRYSIYCTAFKGLYKWPQGFFNFLQACYTRNAKDKHNNRPFFDFGVIYSSYLERAWRGEQFSFVQEAFDEYLITHFEDSLALTKSNRYRERPEFAAKIKYASLSESARVLGSTTKTIRKLANIGYLRKHEPAWRKSPLDFMLYREEVYQLQQEWNNSIPLETASDLLGTSKKVTVDLVQSGFLRAVRGPLVDGTQEWRFLVRDVEVCSDKILGNIRHTTFREDIPDLVKASQMLSNAGIGVADILISIAEGRICAMFYKYERDSIRDIRIDQENILLFLARIKVERGWLGREEAAQYLSVKITTLNNWVKHGLLTPIAQVGNILYLDKENISAFWDVYCTSDIAAEILSVTRLTVQEWSRQQRLDTCCVSGPHIDNHHTYIFHKERLRQWRYERLTVGEAVSLLGVSRATVHRWVERGKIIPLSDLNVKQRWFKRSDIESLLSTSSTLADDYVLNDND